MLPTFLIIGAMKAGTSSLWYYLQLHPEVQMSEVKELDFFVKERNWHRGLEWYESQFRVNRRRIRAVGEASTNYTKYPSFSGVPARIASILPDVQLIYLVRDPIERIRSMYVHMVHRGSEERTFDEVMTTIENNDYIELSLYHFQLTRYLTHFSKEQILVIASEDLRNKRRETLKRVFRSIGVKDNLETPGFDVLANRSEQKRRINHLGKVFQLLRLHDRFLHRLPAPTRRVYGNLTTSIIPKPHLSQELRERLVEVIQPDMERLRVLVGQEFRSWSL